MLHQRKGKSSASTPGADKSASKGGGKAETKTSVVAGVGVEGCKMPSPSRVNTLSIPLQAVIAIACFVGIGWLAVLCNSVADSMKGNYLFDLWRSTWPLLGLFYAMVGISHFVAMEDNCNIVPPNGTWGFWYLPIGARLAVQISGVVEILFGCGLVLGKVFGDWPSFTSAGLFSDSAFVCLILTIAVTPANIYMFTHGARMPKKGSILPIYFHIIRGIFQVYFLAVMWQMAQPTIDLVSGGVVTEGISESIVTEGISEKNM